MVFTNKHIDENLISIKIEDVMVDRVHECKFLGGIIDSKLTWKPHIMRVKEKLIKCNAIMFKASVFLDEVAMRTLYCSLFLPYINYCSVVWGKTYTASIDCISKAQKRAIRIVCKANFSDHTNELFSRLKLLKFSDLVDYKIAIMMYNASLNLLPQNVQRYFSDNCNRVHSLRNDNKFKVIRARTVKKSHCLSVFGVKLFNSLPKDIVSAKNIFHFKLLFKKYIFHKYSVL